MFHYSVEYYTESSDQVAIEERNPQVAEEYDEERVGYDLQPEELSACVGVAQAMNL